MRYFFHKYSSKIILSVLSFTIILSCIQKHKFESDKKELDENQKKQEAEIAALEGAEKPKLDAYLAANKITTAPTASGLIFIETQKGKGAHPSATDVVTVH